MVVPPIYFFELKTSFTFGGSLVSQSHVRAPQAPARVQPLTLYSLTFCE